MIRMQAIFSDAMTKSSRYRILANPVSGSMPAEKRRTLLKQAADVLGADIFGLDTTASEELAQCAREQAEHCDVLVVAGGDGTMSLVINAIDLAATTLAFLPFGTGNALTHALSYRGSLSAIAGRILRGAIYEYDLIDCDQRRKAFMVSLGFDGAMIQSYERCRAMGYRGLNAHLRAGLRAFFRQYQPTGGHITMNRRTRRVERLFSLMVVKQPFFGMGLKAVPRARWDDAKLHAVTVASGLSGILAGLITGFTIGNQVGDYRRGEKITVRLDAPRIIQIDGELGWASNRFAFRVLPGVLRLKH